MKFAMLALAAVLYATSVPVAAQGDQLHEISRKALRRAVGFYREQVALQGGYQYHYSADLRRSIGEGSGSASSVTVQPPGTPAVGLAFLQAFDATGDSYYLEAARETAACLIRGQVRSGGWDYRVEFDLQERPKFGYRNGPEISGQRNITNLDDNTTQTAVLFLARLDRLLQFRDTAIHEAVEYALGSLMRAQYPNGAWPQRYSRFPEPGEFPVKRAGFPAQWPRTWPEVEYYGYYTFNDNTILDMIRTMFEIAGIYDDARYRQAARKAADFILLAQMPDPQPAWAQQYDAEMHPVWARRFEPPAVSGRESQDIMFTLLDVYRETGDSRYLEPIPRAIRYLRGSRLPDGRLARFYELRTNKPLYFTGDYRLTYSDADVPTHYSFKVESRLDQIEERHKRLLAMGPGELEESLGLSGQDRGRDSRDRLMAEQIVDALDEQGRWVEVVNQGAIREQLGERVISSATFVRNVGILCDYIRAARPSN